MNVGARQYMDERGALLDERRASHELPHNARERGRVGPLLTQRDAVEVLAAQQLKVDAVGLCLLVSGLEQVLESLC